MSQIISNFSFDGILSLSEIFDNSYGSAVFPDINAPIQPLEQQDVWFTAPDLWGIWSNLDGLYLNTYLAFDNLIVDGDQFVSGDFLGFAVTQNDGVQDDSEDDEPTVLVGYATTDGFSAWWSNYKNPGSDISDEQNDLQFTYEMLRGDDNIIGSSSDDIIIGFSGNDTMWGGDGEDTFVFQGKFGNDLILDFELGVDELVSTNSDFVPFETQEGDYTLSKSANGDAVISVDLPQVTLSGSVTLQGVPYEDLIAHLSGDDSASDLPDPLSDIFIVQRGIVGKGSGYDEYILSKWTVEPGAEITITDSGANALQFINGFEVSSSMVAANAMMLTLSNGAVITVLDAASYDYTVGGNPLENASGLAFSFQTFVEDVLGVDMPTGSQISRGDAVTITSDMSFGNDVIVTSGSTVSGTDAADEFQLDVSNGGVFEIAGFDVAADSLALSGLVSADGSVLAELIGDPGVGGQSIGVQYNPFSGETFVNLGIDADSEVVALTLVGITQDDWSSLAVV